MARALPDFTLVATLQRWAGATRDFVTARVSLMEDPFPLSSIFNKVRSKTIYGVVSRQNFVFQNLFAEIKHGVGASFHSRAYRSGKFVALRLEIHAVLKKSQC